MFCPPACLLLYCLSVYLLPTLLIPAENGTGVPVSRNWGSSFEAENGTGVPAKCAFLDSTPEGPEDFLIFPLPSTVCKQIITNNVMAPTKRLDDPTPQEEIARLGGFSRAAVLTRKQRAAIARQGAIERWRIWRAANPEQAAFRAAQRANRVPRKRKAGR